MEDAKAHEALGHFLGDHRGAIIGQEGTRQAAFLDRLGKAVNKILGGFREVPLDVTAQSRVVIEDAQRQRAHPLAAGGQDLEGAMMEIQVPQGADVLRLEAADLASLAALLGKRFAGASLDRGHRPANVAVRLHVSPDRVVRAERSERRVALHDRGEVVVVELVGSVRVVVVLLSESLGQHRGD